MHLRGCVSLSVQHTMQLVVDKAHVFYDAIERVKPLTLSVSLVLPHLVAEFVLSFFLIYTFVCCDVIISLSFVSVCLSVCL